MFVWKIYTCYTEWKLAPPCNSPKPYLNQIRWWNLTSFTTLTGQAGVPDTAGKFPSKTGQEMLSSDDSLAISLDNTDSVRFWRFEKPMAMRVHHPTNSAFFKEQKQVDT